MILDLQQNSLTKFFMQELTINIQFHGPSIWNSIDTDVMLLSLSWFKRRRKDQYLETDTRSTTIIDTCKAVLIFFFRFILQSSS